MKRMNRRDFLSRSGQGLAGAALGSVVLTAARPGKVLGANEKVTMALIGCGGRGRGVMAGMVKNGAQVAYVCDVNDRARAAAAKQFGDMQGRAPKQEIEMRKVFEDKSVDAVMISTPEHWHALGTVWACQAGKDVYVEKNPSINIWEGRKMVEAARKYRRVVTSGFQNRSAPYGFSAREYIKSGKLGKVVHVKCFNLLGGRRWHGQADGQVPAGLDWDRWLGPAPKIPYNPGVHSMKGRGGWGSYWAYSGGLLADDASHVMDLARRALDDPDHPQAVYHMGGNQAFNSGRETPEIQAITYDYGDFVMTCESGNCMAFMSKSGGDVRYHDKFPYWPQNSTRIEIYGTKRMMYLGRHGGGWQVFEGGAKVVDQEYGYHPDREHQPNFLECVKSRKMPHGDIEESHKSAVLVHMGNIAYRVGNQRLRFNAKTERFIGNDAANTLVKFEGHYREPYTIPENV